MERQFALSERSEQPIARVAEPGQDVALRVQLAVERGAVHDDVGVRAGEALDALGRRDEAHEPDARRAGALE